MSFIMPPVYRRAKLTLVRKKLTIDDANIDIDEIKVCEAQPAWTPFIGMTSDVTLTLRDGRKIVARNVRKVEAERLLARLGETNRDVHLVRRPLWITGKRLLVPDVSVPSLLAYGIILIAAVAILLVLATA